MKRLKRHWQEGGALLLLALLVVFFYRQLPLTFFQQDEWSGMGSYLATRSEGTLAAWLGALGVGSVLGHFNPLVELFNIGQFTFFGLNFELYACASIFFHLVNSFTFYVLAKMLFKDWQKAFVACLLFALNSLPHQATTWMGTYVATQPVLFLGLLSLIFFVRYLEKPKLKTLVVSLALVFLGLSFRESAAFLFLLYPLWAYFAQGIKAAKKVLAVALIFLFLFCFPRLLLAGGAGGVTATFSWFQIGYRLLTIPLKTLAQVIIFPEWIMAASGKLIAVAYPYFDAQRETTFYDYTTQTIGSDIISYAIALALIGVALVFRSRLLLGSLLFIFLSSLPFAFIPGKAGTFSFLDSRYLHFASLGAAVFLVLLVSALTNLPRIKFLKPVIVFFLAMVFGLGHYLNLQQNLAVGVARGQERRKILATISTAYPELSAKSVFYTESSKSFYGLPVEEKILPFQSGFGQTLLVWYSFRGDHLPGCLFKDRFLWEIEEEGYRECFGRGFGYFRNYDKLVKLVKTNALKPEAVFAFSYDAGGRRLTDITLKTRERIKHDLAKN